MRASNLLLFKSLRSVVDAGYVPQDKPGASGYFTPRASALHANECFNQSDCTQRNPVLSNLHGELRRNPFRHRSDRKLHSHVQVHLSSDIILRPSLADHRKNIDAFWDEKL